MGSEWILRRLAGGVWSRFHWLRIGAGGGLFQCGDEPAGSCATELQSAFHEKVPAGGLAALVRFGGKVFWRVDYRAAIGRKEYDAPAS
jgi:hypothetical protein